MAPGIDYLLASFNKPVLVSTIPGLEAVDQAELAESLYDLGLFAASQDDADDEKAKEDDS